VTTPDTTGVVITLPQIYAEVKAMAKTVDKLDTGFTSFTSEVSKTLSDHENRIRADEANRWPWPRAVAVATVVATVIAFAALFVSRT
jgi:hypothetical protein